MITGTIMDQKQMLRGLRHEQLQERLVIVRVKAAFNALIEQTLLAPWVLTQLGINSGDCTAPNERA
jgi:hypothetical protein